MGSQKTTRMTLTSIQNQENFMYISMKQLNENSRVFFQTWEKLGTLRDQSRAFKCIKNREIRVLVRSCNVLTLDLDRVEFFTNPKFSCSFSCSKQGTKVNNKMLMNGNFVSTCFEQYDYSITPDFSKLFSSNLWQITLFASNIWEYYTFPLYFQSKSFRPVQI